MVRVYESDGSHLFFRRPNGYVALDTSKPMPALIGEVAFTNVQVAFPKTPGENGHGEVASGSIRYWMTTPAYSALVGSINLGAFTGSVAPSIIYGRVRIRYVTQGGNATGYLNAPLALNEWIEWPGGSLLLEHFGQNNKIWLWRHIDISVSNGRWYLNMRQGNDEYTTAKTFSPVLLAGTASTFSIDLQLAWGVFK